MPGGKNRFYFFEIALKIILVASRWRPAKKEGITTTEKITQKRIREEPPGEARKTLRDHLIPGLVVRIQPSGKRSYYLDYRKTPGRKGKKASYRLGDALLLTLPQARDAAKEFLSRLALGEDPAAWKQDTKKGTLREFLTEKYFPWLRQNRKTWHATEERITRAFAGLLEKQPEEIVSWDLEKIRLARKQAGRKPSSINRDETALQAALNWGVYHGFLEKNPIKGMKKLKEAPGVVRYLSEEERERLYSTLDAREERIRKERISGNAWRLARGVDPLPELSGFADHLKPMVLLSLHTGLRRGELFSLTWEDVTLSRSILTVRAETSKTGKARHIPLNREALEVLKRWKIQTGKSGLVFPSPKTGERIDNVNRAWKTLMEEAQIKAFRWHDMRHDFASRLVMRGVDLNTVRELLGHANLKMTLRYAHLSPERLENAVALLEDLPEKKHLSDIMKKAISS